jgi:hypothetical protein
LLSKFKFQGAPRAGDGLLDPYVGVCAKGFSGLHYGERRRRWTIRAPMTSRAMVDGSGIAMGPRLKLLRTPLGHLDLRSAEFSCMIQIEL